MKTGIVWFRKDLRIADNPALSHACEICDVVIPLYINDSNSVGEDTRGSASNVWLHHSLQCLSNELASRYKATLIIREGSCFETLSQLANEVQATHVFWNRCYFPQNIRRDTSIKSQLSKSCEVKTYKAALINEPWELLKKDDTPYRVFTPFWKRAIELGVNSQPLPAPAKITPPSPQPETLTVSGLDLLVEHPYEKMIISSWSVGEEAAHKKLEDFLTTSVTNYPTSRDLPATDTTSCLSPHFHFGEISPRQVIYAAYQQSDQNPAATTGIHKFISEIGWREFAYYLIYHFPHMIEEPLNQNFIHFPWKQDYEDNLKAWQSGLTGYPLIDAGMRQLWQTGWMHNRVRMVTASFLTKNLLTHWQHGEKWFRNTLVDADLASNVMGWQWVAGSGADAAPYFRIFNPLLQSKKFDPDGEYIRRWVPELSKLDNKNIHLPSETIEGYPAPIVDLKTSRERALASYKNMKLKDESQR